MNCKKYKEFRLRDAVRGCYTADKMTPESMYFAMIGEMYDHVHTLKILGHRLSSDVFMFDARKGLCDDMDCKSIRYLKYVETREGKEKKIYKMRAGKFLRKLCEEHHVIEWYGEPLVNYACERFQREWEAYAAPRMDDRYKLVVDDDFESIYSDTKYVSGNFHSCMVNQDQHDFYECAVSAKAASLRTVDDEILARCIVFTDVRDERSGETLKLAERQYSADSDEMFMRILIDKLIAEGYIDGYKRIGCGCGDANAFVSNSGEDWSNRHFSIECDLDDGDTLSYQDSFKWYDIDERRAYNYEESGAYDDLSTTDHYFNGGSEYDEYHGRYCREVVDVYYHEQWIPCDEDDLEDFVEWRGDYYHMDDCFRCPECNEWIPYRAAEEGRMYYSDITEEDYCCDYCLQEAERRFKEDYWWYSELTEDYYETEDELDRAEKEYAIGNDSYSFILRKAFAYEEDMEEAEYEALAASCELVTDYEL